MTRIILLLVIVCSGCSSQNNNWFYGDWVMDKQKSIESASESSKKNFWQNEKYHSLFEQPLRITISEDKLMIQEGETLVNLPYQLVHREDGGVTLDTDSKDMSFFKDEKGVYVVVKKIGQEEIKIYFKSAVE